MMCATKLQYAAAGLLKEKSTQKYYLQNHFVGLCSFWICLNLFKSGKSWHCQEMSSVIYQKISAAENITS